MKLHEVVLGALKRHNMVLAGELFANPDVDNGIYIPIKVSRVSGRINPSQKKIIDFKNDLTASGITPEFILIDKAMKSIEGDVRTSVLTSRSDLVRNVFVNKIGKYTEVWIDEKISLDKSHKSLIEKNIIMLFELIKAENVKIYYMNEHSIATNTEIMSVIRKNSPVDAAGLLKYLEALDFAVPSLDWINRKLDALRKAGSVMSLPNRSFVLTAGALHRLGTRKDRHSPDVSRLLALARRGG